MAIRLSDKAAYLYPAGQLFIVVAVVICFFPGLHSGFIFDDFPNLDALEHIRGMSVMSAGFWEFVLGGQAGPTGRPLSLLTFALQANSWPDDPISFKLVNLAIHCMSAVLVFRICNLLARALKIGSRDLFWFCFFSSLLWAIHPIHTATVFYAVQRMALLSNFFILAGIFSYLIIRLSNLDDHPARKLVYLTLSLAIPGALAMLCKENGLSLIFYVLVLEYTILKDSSTGRNFIRWRYIFLWLPAAIVLLLPVVFWGRIQQGYELYSRFTAMDRLLTESRILWQYLGVLLSPTVSGTSLFHDITPSTSLLAPATTLLSILGWVALLVLACLKPGKHRILLFALLWYFSGHIVESTVLALELYFNHRNYLAFLGPIIALVYFFFVFVPRGGFPAYLKPAVSVFYGGLLAFQTAAIGNLWSEPLRLAENWFAADPDTTRNAEFYAIQLADTGIEGLARAAEIYDEGIAGNPGEFRLVLNRMVISCASSVIPPPDEAFINQHLEAVDPESTDLLSPLQQLVRMATENQCNIYSPELLSGILARLEVVADDGAKGLYDFELAKLKLYAGENDEAIQLMISAYGRSRDPGILFSLSIALVNAGRYEEALGFIDEAIARLAVYNDIRTGTRSEKLAILNGMRADVSGFMNE